MGRMYIRRTPRFPRPLAGLMVAFAMGCGGGGGNGSPTAPPPMAQPYSVGGQLLLQNVGTSNRYTILQAEIIFDGNAIAPCEQTNTPIVNGAQSLCGNIYRVSGVAPGTHTIGCRLTRQTDGAQHNYGCYGAFQVFQGSETVSSRQLDMMRGRIRAGDKIEIQVSVP